MGDRYPAQIFIGGQVSRTAKSKTDPDQTVLEALLGAIATEGVSVEYGGAEVCPDDEATLLEFIDDTGGLLHFRNEQAIDGEIPDLEEFCRTEGLPFRRDCCCYGGYLGENVTCTADGDMVMILETDDGHEQVDGGEVRRAMEMLERYFNPDNDGDTGNPALKDQALSILQGLCPTVPDIPKFEVID